MTRSVQDWIGKTDDTPAPPRVRLRVFEAHAGICFLSGRKIRAGMKWELHHKIALINGGDNAEWNLAPVLVAPHKVQTKADKAEKKLVYRKRSKHLGLKRQGPAMPGTKRSELKKHFDGRVTRR